MTSEIQKITILCCALIAPLSPASEEIKDVFEDRSLDMSKPASRAKAVERIKAIENKKAARVLAMAQARGLQVMTPKPDGGMRMIYDFDGDQPIYIETLNHDAAISTRVNFLQTSPYNLDGTGLLIGVWDGGAVLNTHQEFVTGGRVNTMDGSALNSHATHVAGTIAAAGVNPNSRGMASNALIEAYDYANDLSEMTSRAANAPGQFAEKIYLSNHSYGFNFGWNGNRWSGTGTDQNAVEHRFGQYSGTSRNFNDLAYNFPYYLTFWAAGNQGDSGPNPGNMVDHDNNPNTPEVPYDPAIHPPANKNYRNGFELITGFQVAKNVVTVGAVDDAVTNGAFDLTKATRASFSSTGPTDDGRIKPDLVANGIELLSTGIDNDTHYREARGTSMSAPNATGSAALVVDQYKRLFDSAMRSSTLKGLLIHTADDLGNPGPDYHYGWGLINTQYAVDIVIDHHANPPKNRITEDALTTSVETRTYSFVWDGSSPIRATLCWTDPPGTATTAHDSRTPTLVNDLDLTVIAPDGTIHYPYVMPFVGTWTVESMSEPATTGINNTDNVEQVFIPNPDQTGIWQAVVSHQGTLTNDSQQFGLILSGSAGANILISQPGGSTNVTEGGASDTYSIALTEQPTADVTLTLTPDSQVNVSPSNLTFTENNWEIPQQVTVTAVNDTIFEAFPHPGIILHSVSSADPFYNGISRELTVNVFDNDNTLPVVNAGPNQYALLTGGLWSPQTNTPGLWLDASDDTKVTLNGSNVSTWEDKSGNNRHANQNTTTRTTCHPTHPPSPPSPAPPPMPTVTRSLIYGHG